MTLRRSTLRNLKSKKGDPTSTLIGVVKDAQSGPLLLKRARLYVLSSSQLTKEQVDKLVSGSVPTDKK